MYLYPALATPKTLRAKPTVMMASQISTTGSAGGLL